MRTPLLLILVIGLIWGCIYYEYAVWKECLSDHSWFYCSRVLSK